MLDKLTYRKHFVSIMTWLPLLLAPAVGVSGELIIHNVSPNTITCTADGYTVATGWPTNWQIQVLSGTKFYLAPNFNREPPVINWVNCGGLQTRMMNITPSGPDGLVVVNGQQTRVLNILLYPYIPSNPNANFTNLVKYVIGRYQALRPQVLANVVMNQDVDIYSFKNLQTLVGPGGFDVLELDTSFLTFLLNGGLIAPVSVTGEPPWPVGLTAVTLGGKTYGIPSWLCTDFGFSFQQGIKQAGSLAAFLQFLAAQPSTRPELVADYNGSWTIPTMYINAYVQNYGYQSIKNAFNMPPDPVVIQNLTSLVSTCLFSGANNCVDNTYHKQPTGTTEKIMATGNASSDMGFSEQSFYILLYQTVAGTTYAIPLPWGKIAQPVLFTDAFVNNSSTCAGGACADDSQALTTLMTSASMKTFIAYSQDLPVGTPPRHLLVATQPFWSQPEVQQDALYQQFSPVLQSGQPFPNWFTPANHTAMYTQVCAALKKRTPTYVCPQ